MIIDNDHKARMNKNISITSQAVNKKLRQRNYVFIDIVGNDHKQVWVENKRKSWEYRKEEIITLTGTSKLRIDKKRRQKKEQPIDHHPNYHGTGKKRWQK